jgi:hypothetical protein
MHCARVSDCAGNMFVFSDDSIKLWGRSALYIGVVGAKASKSHDEKQH